MALAWRNDKWIPNKIEGYPSIKKQMPSLAEVKREKENIEVMLKFLKAFQLHLLKSQAFLAEMELYLKKSEICDSSSSETETR